MPFNADDGSGADWIDHYLDNLQNGPTQTGLGGPKEGPGLGNPYAGFSGPGPGSMGPTAGGAGSPLSGSGGDRFSRGMEWLGADVANNGSGRLDRGGPFSPAGVGAGNPKEPPGGGDPYAAAAGRDMTGNLASFLGSFDPSAFGPAASTPPDIWANAHGEYAGAPTYFGAPPPDAAAIDASNQASANRGYGFLGGGAGPGFTPPAAASPFDSNPFGALAAQGGLGNGSAGIMSQSLPFAQPTPPPFQQQPAPPAQSSDFRDFLKQLVQQAGGSPMPSAGGSGGANYPRYADPTNPLTGAPIGSAQNPITGFQGAGLNRQIPASLRGSSIGQMVAGEEPFLQNALIAPDDGSASPAWNQLMSQLRGNRGAPAAGFRPPRGRPRF